MTQCQGICMAHVRPWLYSQIWKKKFKIVSGFCPNAGKKACLPSKLLYIADRQILKRMYVGGLRASPHKLLAQQEGRKSKQAQLARGDADRSILRTSRHHELLVLLHPERCNCVLSENCDPVRKLQPGKCIRPTEGSSLCAGIGQWRDKRKKAEEELWTRGDHRDVTPEYNV